MDAVWDKAKRERKQLSEKLHASNHICLFGCGQVGQAVAYDLAEAGVRVDFFCDNNSKLWGRKINQGAKCISIHELERYRNDVLILVTTGYFQEVCEQLRSLNFRNVFVVPQLMIPNNSYWDTVDCSYVKNKVCRLLDAVEDEASKKVVRAIVHNWFTRSKRFSYEGVCTEDQYFPSEIVALNDHEVFVDVGAFDGDTTKTFLSRVGDFDKIIAYELDKTCFRKFKQYASTLDDSVKHKVVLYNLGLYDRNQTITYIPNSTSSAIKLSADEQADVVRLSDHLHQEKITFVKMDIEGAEVKALLGAEEIIKKRAPKLAVCVYHTPEHLWKIPLYLKKIVPEYKVYLRHHTAVEYETVCYAVV
jgi:FkbM family methyltransferase